ncbi:helix-turn-helix transcriptional regulator [Clostridium sp. ZBS13]|uniref:PadR family transcriptional regulator n=1 Tax=Clostridium sp. ZBS13 TaxID=2949971 RepID=UPI00207B0760|nr:helix-turn-helix transcriptional regulator [Clostridium sp. ZBS13]
MDREILKGFLDILLLSLLKNNDMYGYELSKTIKELSNNKLSVGEGTLYPALKRLEEKKYIDSYWVERGGKLIKRKYYKITIEGITTLKEKINDYEIINSLLVLCMEESINE